MKTLQKIICSLSLLLVCTLIYPQVIKPVITFEDDPLTHNMGIASDGSYYYTINGGVTNKGQINKYSLNGNYIDSYEISLDMRSVFYNKKDMKFYVNCYDKGIYRITDITTGKFELIEKDLYENEQLSMAMSDNGKLLYCFDKGELKIYKFPKLKLYKTIKGIDYGSGITSGETSIAVSKNNFFTCNSSEKMIFVYDLKGNKIKTVYYSSGDYSFSLSYANGLLFIANDGNYDIGTWFGYKIDD